MKFKLNKKTLKNLSKDSSVLPADMTPQVAGGGFTANCNTDGTKCEETVQCDGSGACGGGGGTWWGGGGGTGGS